MWRGPAMKREFVKFSYLRMFTCLFFIKISVRPGRVQEKEKSFGKMQFKTAYKCLV